MACSEWKVPWFPVKPWQITLVFLSTRMDIVFFPDSILGLCGLCFIDQRQHFGGADLLQIGICEIGRAAVTLAFAVQIVAVAGIGEVEFERRRGASLSRDEDQALAVAAARHQPLRAAI